MAGYYKIQQKTWNQKSHETSHQISSKNPNIHEKNRALEVIQAIKGEEIGC